LRKAHPDQVTIERFDITEPDQIVALRDRLSGHVFDMLFVNAGIAKHNQAETIPQLAIHSSSSRAPRLRFIDRMANPCRGDRQFGHLASVF
jgi:NAD(P)-dependent dehydrogenase (short-subunit alcohol dehydrogenase family)